MRFSVSTNWNAHRHSSAQAMVDEIRASGADEVELGYNLKAPAGEKCSLLWSRWTLPA